MVVKKYYTTLEITVGCGDRVQTIIDKAYNDIMDAYEKLTDDQKTTVTLPKKEKPTDDGNFGLATGPFAGLANRR